MSQLRAIADSRPWWTMIPDQGLFAHGVGSDRTLNAARRTLDRRCAMLYVSTQTHVLVHIDRIAARHVKATWVNPQTGEAQDAGVYATGNMIEGRTFPRPTVQWFSTPSFWEDGVLILDGVD